MNETAKDFFIKKVESANTKKEQINKKIFYNGIFAASGVILGTIVYVTEGYPFDNQLLEETALACSFYMGISGSTSMIKGLCEKAQLNQKNNQPSIKDEIELEKPKQYIK